MKLPFPRLDLLSEDVSYNPQQTGDSGAVWSSREKQFGAVIEAVWSSGAVIEAV